MNIKHISALSLFCAVSYSAELPTINKYEFSKDTCHKTWHGSYLSTDKERKTNQECHYSRFEAYDRTVQRYIGYIAYNSSRCFIEYLRVDEKYKMQGIGRALTEKALEDLIKHGCDQVFLDSHPEAKGFWEKLGAKPDYDGYHVFSNLVPNQLK